MLFLIYIDYIETSTSLNILSYADDTTVYQSGPNVDNLIINTNHGLKLSYDSLCANKLSLNVKRQICVYLVHKTVTSKLISTLQ